MDLKKVRQLLNEGSMEVLVHLRSINIEVLNGELHNLKLLKEDMFPHFVTQNEAIRTGVVLVIGRAAVFDWTIRKRLREMLSSENQLIRAEVAHAVGHMCLAGNLHGPAVAPLLNDHSPIVRARAAECLGRVKYIFAVRELQNLISDCSESGVETGVSVGEFANRAIRDMRR